MIKKYYELIEQCNDYLEKYPQYTEIEKINSAYEIFSIINGISNSKEFRIINLDEVENLRDVCIELDCALGLIYLDFSLAQNWYYNRDSINYLQNGSTNYIPELIKRSLMPYVTQGLKHQLSINQRLFMKAEDLGNESLSRNSRMVFTDIIHGAMWLESELKKLGINTKILKEAVKDFTPEQLGFIYAQLSAFDRYESSFDEEAREELYQLMKNKDLGSKKEFIRTICLLGYANTAEGITAMMMDMYDICGSEGICHMMYEFMMNNGELKYGISNNYFISLLSQSREAEYLRKKDIHENKEVKTVKQYMNKAYTKMQTRKKGYY